MTCSRLQRMARGGVAVLALLLVGAESQAQEAPTRFYRVFMLEFDDLKLVDDSKPQGKRQFNLFFREKDARDYLKDTGNLPDRHIYVFTAEDLAKTEDGRAFLEEVNEIFSQPDQWKTRGDVSMEVTNAATFRRTITDNARFVDVDVEVFERSLASPASDLNTVRQRLDTLARQERRVAQERAARNEAYEILNPECNFVFDTKKNQLALADPDVADPAEIVRKWTSSDAVPTADPGARFAWGVLRLEIESNTWVFSVSHQPAEHLETWKQLFAQIADRPDGAALDGMVLDFDGRRAIDGGLWLKYAKRLGGLSPTVPADPTSTPAPDWPTERFFPHSAPEEPIRPLEEPRRPIDIDLALAEFPPIEPGPRTAPSSGPVGPGFAQEVAEFLRGYRDSRLRADVVAGNFSVFEHELFRRGADSPEGREATRRAWKKVCSSPEFAEHSQQLAELRWRMVVDLWAEAARDHAVRVELIDSGKRNAYRSDLDLTVYSPLEGRGTLSIKSLIDDFRARFETQNGYAEGALDIQIHDGDAFIPDIRDNGQSVADYRATLREVTAELRRVVKTGGDAFFVPGANLEVVQKRAVRDGRVTILEPKVEVLERSADGTALRTRLAKPLGREVPIRELDRNPGAWKSNATRFEGFEPTYDRHAAFGVMVQVLEELGRPGQVSEPASIAKQFNRAMNLGLGAGQVNSYWDIHVSDLSDAAVPGDGELLSPTATEVAYAFMLEGQGPPSEYEYLTNAAFRHDKLQRARTKRMAKLRWIIRTFGVKHETSGSPEEVLRQYELLETAAAIEQEKIRGGDVRHPDRGRSTYLKRYFDGAVEWLKRRRPEALEGSDARVEDAIYEQAWRRCYGDLLVTLKQAIVIEAARAFADMTPEGFRRNAFRFMIQGGEVLALPNDAAAAKLAEQRRVELALLFEIIESLPDEEAALREELRDEVIRRSPESIRADVKRLAAITAAEMDSFLRAEGRTGPAGIEPRSEAEREAWMAERRNRMDTWLAEKRRLVQRETAQIDGPPATARALAEHIERNVRWRANPMDAGFVGQMLQAGRDAFVGQTEAWLAELRKVKDWWKVETYTWLQETDIHAPTPAEVASGKTRGSKTFDQITHNFAPLMLGSSAIDLVRAYRTGDPLTIADAWFTQICFFLPPQWGFPALAVKDFGRGHLVQGVKTFGFLGAITYGSKLLPGLGEGVLLFNIASGLVEIPIAYVTQQIDDDLILQALMSRPVGLEAAERNRYSGDGERFRRTPSFPLLFDNPCMKAPDDGQALWALAAKADQVLAPIIERRLLNEALRPGSTSWDARRLVLAEVEGANLPFYQRISRIYECFRDQEDQLLSAIPDYDRRLDRMFTPVVREWFDKQPVSYQGLYDPWWDVLGMSDSRDRLQRRLTRMLVGYYDHFRWVDVMRKDAGTTLPAAIERKMREWLVLEAALLAAKENLLQNIQQKLATSLRALIAQAAAARKVRTPASVELDVPTWYQDLTGLAARPGATGTGPSVKGTPDASKVIPLPVDVVVRASREDHPEPWEIRGYRLSLAEVRKGRPEGLELTAEEEERLARRGPDDPPNEVVTLGLLATASAYDAAGAKIADAVPTPIVGYAIVPARVTGTATIAVHARVPSPRVGRGEPQVTLSGTAREIRADVVVQGRQPQPATPTAAGSSSGEATLGGLSIGSHTVTVTSRMSDFGDATVAIVIPDPWSPEATALAERGEDPLRVRVDVDLPYKAPEEPIGTEKPERPDIPRPGGTGGRGATAGGRGGQPAAGGAAGAEGAKPGTGTTGGAGTSGGQTGQAGGAGQPGSAQVEQQLGAIEEARRRCDPEGALALAESLGRTELTPVAAARLAGNLPSLTAEAQARRLANTLLASAQAALRTDLEAAVNLVRQALQVPSLPDCMKDPIRKVLVELEVLLSRRRRFIALTQAVVAAADRCDYAEARHRLADIEAITPRDASITQWLNENTPRIAEGDQRTQAAVSLIDQASAILQRVMFESECQRAVALLERARDTALACIETLQIDERLQRARERCTALSPLTTVPPSVVPEPTKPPVNAGVSFDWSGSWVTDEVTLTLQPIDAAQGRRWIGPGSTYDQLACPNRPDVKFFRGQTVWMSRFGGGQSWTGVGSLLACTRPDQARPGETILSGLFVRRTGERPAGRFQLTGEQSQSTRFQGVCSFFEGGIPDRRWTGIKQE